MPLLFVILGVGAAYYGAVILLLFRGLGRRPEGRNAKPHFLSVIVAARNEETLIERCLRGILSQNYPADRFEVIAVDDRSEDGTLEKMKALARVRVIAVDHCPPGISPKKNALARGIAEAKGEIFVFTDADCAVPVTWLSTLNRHFENGVAAVAGLTTYHSVSGISPLFFGLQAVDFFSHAVVSAGAIGAGIPLTVNANNFSVRRETYERAESYRLARDVVSGDDDLLLHSIDRAGEARIRYCFSLPGAVTTEPTPTPKAVWEQRKRWGSKTVYYNRKQAALLSGVFIFYCMVLGLVVAACIVPSLFSMAAAAFLFKTALDLVLLWRGAFIFGKERLLPYFFPMSLLHIPLIVFACFFGIFGRFRWKGGEFRRKL